jgi:hypothetical protein
MRLCACEVEPIEIFVEALLDFLSTLEFRLGLLGRTWANQASLRFNWLEYMTSDHRVAGSSPLERQRRKQSGVLAHN